MLYMFVAHTVCLLLYFFTKIGVLFYFSFTREKVFRLKPVLDKHVTLIKDLARRVQVPVCFHTYPNPYSAVLTHYRGFGLILIIYSVPVQMCKLF